MTVVATMNSKRVTDEIRHANDQLEYFYLEAKRNKKLATWAAKKLGFDKREYFLTLIDADISTAGPKPVVDRIMADFANTGLEISEEDVWAKVRKFEMAVLQDMLDEKGRRTKEEIKAKKKDKKKDRAKKDKKKK